MLAFLLVLLSYLLGSIPTAYVVGKLLKGIDIREVGDGNAGAANVYREIGHTAGLAVMVVDILKGALAVILAQIFASQAVAFFAGLAAVIGHIRPLYIGFRGGRGESTTIGVLFIFLPQAMLILLALCALPFFITRNTIVAGTIIFSPLWLVALLTGASAVLICYSIALPCIVGVTHVLTTRHLPDDVKQGVAYIR